MKWRIFFIKSLIALTMCSIIVTGCRNAGKWLILEDEMPIHADGIIMLMGSVSDRVLETADIYTTGHAKQVIFVRESMGAYRSLEKRGVHICTSTDQVFNALTQLGIPSGHIHILPGDATSTQMEAMIIRNYLSDMPSVDTLLLVSSSEHMRRATMIFRKAFGKKVTIISCPSSYTGFNGKKWWCNKEGIQTVLLEYIKILNFSLFEKRQIHNLPE